MKSLHRHNLDFDLSLEFATYSLTNVNALCSELLNLIDFKSGIFFTLLTSGADLERLYEFKYGYILPQYPVVTTETNGKKSFSQQKPKVDEEISDFLLCKLNTNNKLSLVFDDVTATPTDQSLKIFYKKQGVYLHENEVLHVIHEHNKSRKFILKCMWHSCSLWHSVGVLTEANCFKNGNILSLENIQTICKETKLILISAYDGEAYVLWEKSS